MKSQLSILGYIKVIGIILPVVASSVWGLNEYVQAQKMDATIQTIEAIKPYFNELNIKIDKNNEDIKKTNVKVDKVILVQEFTRADLYNYKIQNAKTKDELIEYQKEFMNQMFLRTELPDTLKKKHSNNYLSDI